MPVKSRSARFVGLPFDRQDRRADQSRGRLAGSYINILPFLLTTPSPPPFLAIFPTFPFQSPVPRRSTSKESLSLAEPLYNEKETSKQTQANAEDVYVTRRRTVEAPRTNVMNSRLRLFIKFGRS